MLTDVLWGLKAAVRNYRVVLLIWAGYAGLAAVAVAPALSWWRRAFDHATEATTLLRGFNFGVLADLTKYDYVGAFGLLTSTVVGVALLAIAASSFMMGGMLNVISGTGASRGVMHRFFGGGGCFFWRFFRLLLIGGACAVLVVAGLMAAVVAIGSPLLKNASEAGSYLWLVFNVPVLAIGCGLFLLALDYARIHVVANDSRGMLRAYFRALLFVLRHPVTTYGMAILMLIPAAVLMLGYVAYETMSPVAASWGLIALLFGIQQAIVVTRVGLRVSLVHAEFRYAARFASPLGVDVAPVIAVPLEPEANEPVPESIDSPTEARAGSGTGDPSSVDSSSLPEITR